MRLITIEWSQRATEYYEADFDFDTLPQSVQDALGEKSPVKLDFFDIQNLDDDLDGEVVQDLRDWLAERESPPMVVNVEGEGREVQAISDEVQYRRDPS